MPETLEEYDAILTQAEYRKFPKSAMDSSHAVAFYQKRVSDEKGVKFYIDCYLYDHSDIKNVDVPIPIGVEISSYFKGESAAYRLMEYAKDSFDLPATESLFLALWNTGNFNYSKIWGE